MSTSSVSPDIRRTHFDLVVVLCQAAALSCAGLAGFGVTSGLLSPEDGPLLGYAVPIASGLVIGVVLAIAWHVAIGAAARCRSAVGMVGIVAVAMGLTAITIGASAWSVATAFGGKAAVRQHMTANMLAGQQALDATWQMVRLEATLINAVTDGATELRGMAELEEEGRLSGRRGEGPLTDMLRQAASQYEAQVPRLQAVLDDAGRKFTRGRELIQAMQMAIAESDATASPPMPLHCAR